MFLTLLVALDVVVVVAFTAVTFVVAVSLTDMAVTDGCGGSSRGGRDYCQLGSKLHSTNRTAERTQSKRERLKENQQEGSI
ncbi:Hypothetical predicted protein [Octopus vulgaris]|uniref:Uncharacterized protein n=1 Tax=Octopus vulgaris TaxID=6645 RepID=A0AA36B6A7_OCTVU|nr:Hypothetical predicted protein [Octopus vulgaris]